MDLASSDIDYLLRAFGIEHVTSRRTFEGCLGRACSDGQIDVVRVVVDPPQLMDVVIIASIDDVPRALGIK
jgi:hypothetical protein